jgi:hypothetical protein
VANLAGAFVSVLGAVSVRVPVFVRAVVRLVDRAGAFVAAFDSVSVLEAVAPVECAGAFVPALDVVSVRVAVLLVDRAGVFVSVLGVVPSREVAAGAAVFCAASGLAATSVLGFPPFAFANEALSARAAAACCV